MDRVQRGQARETRHQTFGKGMKTSSCIQFTCCNMTVSWLWDRINSKNTRSSLHDKPLRLHLSPCPLPVGGAPATPCSSATKRLAAVGQTANHRRIQLLFCLQILPPNMGCACKIGCLRRVTVRNRCTARDRSTTPMTLGIQPGFGFKPRECRCRRWTKSPCQVLVWNHMPTNPPRVSQKGGWCALHDPAEKCGHKQLLYSRWTLMTPASIWLRSAPIAPHFGRRDAHRRADRRPRQPWRRCRWRHRQRAWPGTSVVSRKNMSRETTWEGRNGPGLQLTALNESVNPRRDPRPAIPTH